MRFLLLIAMCSLFVGCATDMSVRIHSEKFETAAGKLLAQVKVNDLRAPGAAASKREAAFGVPMGNITFVPPESHLVKNTMEVELTKLLRESGVQEMKEYSCDIVEFGVNTNTTSLYWDVIGRIQLILRKDGKQYNLVGTHTERTFVWPGESIVKNVVEESLNQIVTDLKKLSAIASEP